MMHNTFFISGGGTGGHIYPALAVADKLIKDNNTVYYIGCRSNLEYEISKQYSNLVFLSIDFSGMPRKISLKFISWLMQLIISWLKCIYYIKKYKPDAVFASGGYVSAPVIFAAKTLKVPYMIHDCDSAPGLVSKIAAPGAAIVSAAFESSKKYLKSKKIIINGNPVRDIFFSLTKTEAREKLNIPPDKKVIFSMGGSQGAKTINTAMTEILKQLAEEKNFFVIMQTGGKNYDEVMQALEKIYPECRNNKNIIIRPYFDDMAYPLKSADIVVSRAGSLSLSEISQCCTPAILVPYPYAAQDHQRQNAKEVCSRGSAVYLEDSECTGANLLDKINLLDDKTLENMRAAIKNTAEKNPADVILKQLKSCAAANV